MLTPYASAAPGISASSAILIDAASGEALFEHNADAGLKIASTTKILTALVVLERCKLADEVVIKPEYTAVEGSSMYLRAGERLTVRDLLYGLLLASGNDAAAALAGHTAGSIDGFAALMNEKAKSLGCENYGFKNPHGLDADGHFASARDLARITAAAMENRDFAEIVSTKYVSAAGRALKNHNKLLWDYAGTLGVKTGYTKSAGRSLVSCAERGGLRLICVTISDPDDWGDHAALYDWAFTAYRRFTVLRGDERRVELPVISGEERTVSVHPDRDYGFTVGRGETVSTTLELPNFVYAAVIRGARAGTLRVRAGDRLLAEIPLLYSETVRRDEAVKMSAWERVKWAWQFTNAHGNYSGYRFYGY
ncbi:MAG: D-alanyl-D-alanine carboxypeptidase [Oscillospiraceae bacterium]|jgi:D-alanyl-D-alanine carboxypeptidase (penicillin-binding protein 5/6)|nr:D-alanyl-D-alanine carboxypeptidase [Oscillospiraceae bacterium]